MKKIVSLVWYKVSPPLFGGQKGIAHFNQQLAKSFPLTCICSSDNVVQEQLSYKVLPVLPAGKKHVFNPLYWRKVKQLVKKESATVLILEHPYHGIAAWLAARSTGARLIVHSHNIESDRFRLIGKWWWPLLYGYEKWVHRRASLSLFKTQEDQDLAARNFGLSPSKCLIIPYGVERPLHDRPTPSIREQYGILTNEKLLLFAGTLDYEPNADAVRQIYTEIAPRLRSAGFSFRILVCGRNKFSAFRYLHRLTDPSVIMAGEVASIAPYFSEADVFINPVLSGGGIQTKNLDAIAHGCNTVCFDSQSTGIPAEICGSKLTTAANGNWDIFTAQIMKAAGNQEHTPDSFFSYFNWDRILQPLIHNLQTHE